MSEAFEVIDGGLPKIVGEVLELPTDQVDTSGRLRPLDPVWSQALAGIIKAKGQRTPIEVCKLPGKKTWKLVTGLHRHDACRINDQPVRAIVVSADALDRREAEISENIWRRDLNPIDRANFVAELVEVLRAKAGVADVSPQAVAAGARWQKVLKKQAADTSLTIRLAYGFAEDAAARLGLSRPTIYNDLALHRGLLPDVVAKLRGHAIAGNAGQLRALAKLAEADQRAAAGLIVAGKAKGASEALAILRQTPKPDPQVKAWNAFFGAWARMSAKQRAEALAELDQQGLPKGFSLTGPGNA